MVKNLDGKILFTCFAAAIGGLATLYVDKMIVDSRVVDKANIEVAAALAKGPVVKDQQFDAVTAKSPIFGFSQVGIPQVSNFWTEPGASNGAQGTLNCARIYVWPVEQVGPNAVRPITNGTPTALGTVCAGSNPA